MTTSNQCYCTLQLIEKKQLKPDFKTAATVKWRVNSVGNNLSLSIITQILNSINIYMFNENTIKEKGLHAIYINKQNSKSHTKLPNCPLNNDISHNSKYTSEQWVLLTEYGIFSLSSLQLQLTAGSKAACRGLNIYHYFFFMLCVKIIFWQPAFHKESTQSAMKHNANNSTNSANNIHSGRPLTITKNVMKYFNNTVKSNIFQDQEQRKYVGRRTIVRVKK